MAYYTTSYNDDNVCIEFEIEFDFTPGERRVLYFADGSGFPGSSAEVYPTGVKVLNMEGATYFKTREALKEGGYLKPLEDFLMDKTCDDVESGDLYETLCYEVMK